MVRFRPLGKLLKTYCYYIIYNDHSNLFTANALITIIRKLRLFRCKLMLRIKLHQKLIFVPFVTLSVTTFGITCFRLTNFCCRLVLLHHYLKTLFAYISSSWCIVLHTYSDNRHSIWKKKRSFRHLFIHSLFHIFHS